MGATAFRIGLQREEGTPARFGLSLGGEVSPVETSMFLFFSNRVGLLGSILVSLVLTVILLRACAG
jgi:energy-converting hydrogenase Eha subunit E